jgi:hypothetical protein
MSTLELGKNLQRVVRRCETVCESACCGLDAFDFHPIHVASSILAFNDREPSETMQFIEQELRDMEHAAMQQDLDEFGCVGWCETLNMSFRPEELAEWIARMRHCLSDAGKVLDWCRSQGYRG